MPDKAFDLGLVADLCSFLGGVTSAWFLYEKLFAGRPSSLRFVLWCCLCYAVSWISYSVGASSWKETSGGLVVLLAFGIAFGVALILSTNHFDSDDLARSKLDLGSLIVALTLTSFISMLLPLVLSSETTSNATLWSGAILKVVIAISAVFLARCIVVARLGVIESARALQRRRATTFVDD